MFNLRNRVVSFSLVVLITIISIMVGLKFISLSLTSSVDSLTNSLTNYEGFID